jgi:hypothetical protein
MLVESMIESQYEAALLRIWPAQFVAMVLQLDRVSAQHFGGKSKVVRAGGLLLKYAETDTHLLIQGLVSESGNLRLSDADALRDWLESLREKLDAGKIVLTSLNDSSKPLFKRAIRGGKFRTERLDTFQSEFGVWETVQVLSDKKAPVVESFSRS